MKNTDKREKSNGQLSALLRCDISVQFVGNSIADRCKFSTLLRGQLSIGAPSSQLKIPGTNNAELYCFALFFTSPKYSFIACILLLFASFISNSIGTNRLSHLSFTSKDALFQGFVQRNTPQNWANYESIL